MKPRSEWVTAAEVADIRLRHEAGETTDQMQDAHPRLSRHTLLDARNGRLQGIGLRVPGCMTEEDLAGWAAFGVGRLRHDEHDGGCRCQSGPCRDCPEGYALEVRSRPVESRDFPSQHCDGHPGDDGEDHDQPAHLAELKAGRRTQSLQSDTRAAIALVMWQDGMPTKDIAAEMQLGVTTVQAYLLHRDPSVVVDTQATRTARRALEVWRSHGDGLTRAGIAETTGFSISSVDKYLRLHKARISQNVRAKKRMRLTRKLHEAGLTRKAIVAKTSFSPSAVDRYLKREAAA